MNYLPSEAFFKPKSLDEDRIEYRDSEIDEETLKEIAGLTGGLYFRAEDTQGLQEVYSKINELEATGD